nr:Chain B, Snap25b-111-120 [Homo sapiens]5W7I_D Chain D, Snap25b-111-120 [Homo sapiens]5W7J_B Chain B, Snap25b-111-120 [Homo sapiens]5W7J_D Chain D, Snap25b-111-120 [Homo sapiens]
GVVASQPARV